METSGGTTELSLIESTSNHYITYLISLSNMICNFTLDLSATSMYLEKEPSERLKRQLRALESENIELRRAQLRLMDAQGKDCTEEATKN